MEKKHYSEFGYKVFFKLKPALKKILRIKAKGLENFPQKSGFIIASNHRSHLDSPVVNIISPVPVIFLAKAELFKVPVLGWLIKKSGAIPIERNKKSGNKSLIKALKLLKEGYTIGVFPEGTRAKPKEFLKPKAGIGLLISKAKVLVVPVRIEGTDDIFPKGSKFPKIGKTPIYVNVGKPIIFGENIEYEEIANKIMKEIKKL